MNRFVTEKYIIYDGVTDEFLISRNIIQLGWEWGHSSYECKDSATFDSMAEAKIALGIVDSIFKANGNETAFEIHTVLRGTELYERVRRTLIDNYGTSLCDNNTDHVLTEAALNEVFMFLGEQMSRK